MKSKINYRKYFILLLIFTVFSLISYLVYILSINYIELDGDLNYIDSDEVRVLTLNNIKNQNLFINSGDKFKQKLIELNPEIEKIEIKVKDSQSIIIKINNKKTCCVIIDSNRNKFLINLEGKVLKKLSSKSSYPDEIELNQVVDMNSSFLINSLQKLLDIENILISKNIEVLETRLDGKNITFVSKNQKELILDDEVSSKVFVEKLESMLNYLKQNNKDYQKIDFRFGNVIVE
jgi:cell division septal protein FtsQ